MEIRNHPVVKALDWLQLVAFGGVIWGFVTGRIVPRYVRRDLPPRPLTRWERTRIRLQRPAIVDDLYDLRDELQR